MNTNLDDPRLTAYALGELSENERPEIEALLAQSPEARRWVNEVQQTAQHLTREFAHEPCPELNPEQVDVIEARLDRNVLEGRRKEREARSIPWLPRLRLVEVFVVVALIAVLTAMLLPALSRAKYKSHGMAGLNELRQLKMQRDWEEISFFREASAEPEPFAPPFHTESYAHITDNPFRAVSQDPLSTFSIDVDTASYAILRRFLNAGQQPPKDAVRIEEMINYFTYDYPQPRGEAPFSVNVEIAGCPWQPDHRLMRVGLKGREIASSQRPPGNLVFLVDVSGSMHAPNKLPLLKESLKLLVRELSARDRVALVVYAGAAGEVLAPASGSEQRRILRALDSLEAGGSTHGSAGIRLAYGLASENFIEGGVNRVILCTDGDFNVGTTSPGELQRLIEEKAKSGVFLSVLGFGMGNYKDSTVEMLADKGNGNYAYIDTLKEARKVLVEQMSGTLITIAKDVKIQVEFNPAQVSAYRLVGYENRLLNKEDFNNDQKDAGEIGAGHTVTALYEIVPPGKKLNVPGVDPLKYQRLPAPAPGEGSRETATIKLRYKEPEGEASRLITVPVTDNGSSYSQASRDFKFASAVAGFGMILRDSPYKGSATLGAVRELAEEGMGADREGYRREFIELVKKASHGLRK